MAETTPLDIQTPHVFAPLLQPARYKSVWGGRGSGKSHFFAKNLVAQAVMRPGLRVVCIREIQKSLAMSVKQLVTDKIMKISLAGKFELLDKENRKPGSYYGVGGLGLRQRPNGHRGCFITDDVLHIDYAEGGGIGIEVDALPTLFDKVPGSRE